MESTPVRILVVEDNRGDVYLIREALADSGLPHEVSVVEDGEQALAVLQRRGNFAVAPPPDLVLLDLNLPRVDGATVLAYLRDNPGWQRTPVVVLSSSRAPHDMARAAELKNCIYLVKPSDLDEFLAIGKQIASFWQRLKPSPAA